MRRKLPSLMSSGVISTHSISSLLQLSNLWLTALSLSLSGHVVPHETTPHCLCQFPSQHRPVSLGYRRTKCQQTQPVPFSFCPCLFLLPFALVPCSTVTGQGGAISESPSGCNIWGSLSHSLSHGCAELFASSRAPHLLPTAEG